MTPRSVSRVQACDAVAARARLRDARAQLDLAALATADSSPEELKAAASCAVLAGIAAADAACCAALGHRSRSQNHRDAVAVLRQVSPGGSDAARRLERLLGLKDATQYGLGTVSWARLESARRQAGALLCLADRIVTR